MASIPMSWYVLPLIASIAAALINHVDKYLIERFFKGGGIGSLVIVSSLIGVPVFLLISLFVPSVFTIPLRDAGLITLNGMIYILWLLPYLYALEKDEASIVSPLFMLSAIFSLGLGYLLLGESLTLMQSLAALLIAFGSLGLVLDVTQKNAFKIKKQVFMLMSLASLLAALNGVMFKFFALEYSFWVTSFWEYIGFGLMALLFYFLIPSYKKQFIATLVLNKKRVLGTNLINEVLALISKMSLNYAFLFAPVALVIFISEGTQPFFTLLFGTLLTLFFPTIAQEIIQRRFIVQKIIAISVMVFGLYLLR